MIRTGTRVLLYAGIEDGRRALERQCALAWALSKRHGDVTILLVAQSNLEGDASELASDALPPNADSIRLPGAQERQEGRTDSRHAELHRDIFRTTVAEFRPHVAVLDAGTTRESLLSQGLWEDLTHALGNCVCVLVEDLDRTSPGPGVTPFRGAEAASSSKAFTLASPGDGADVAKVAVPFDEMWPASQSVEETSQRLGLLLQGATSSPSPFRQGKS